MLALHDEIVIAEDEQQIPKGEPDVNCMVNRIKNYLSSRID